MTETIRKKCKAEDFPNRLSGGCKVANIEYTCI